MSNIPARTDVGDRYFVIKSRARQTAMREWYRRPSNWTKRHHFGTQNKINVDITKGLDNAENVL